MQLIDQLQSQLEIDSYQAIDESAYSLHLADAADRENLFRRINFQCQILARLEPVLERIKRINYGIFLKSGLPISGERLLAIRDTGYSLD